MDAAALREIEAIKQLKARYFRFLDTKDWDRWIDVFAPDATLIVDHEPSTMGRDGKSGPKVIGAQAILAHVKPRIETASTVHHGHMPEIELTSDTTARGIWAMEDKLWWTNGDHEEHLHGYGHYHEEYRKEDGRWLISYRKLTRLRQDTTPHFFDYTKKL